MALPIRPTTFDTYLNAMKETNVSGINPTLNAYRAARLRNLRQAGNFNDLNETSTATVAYYCYCSESQRYGTLCNAFTNYWIPIRYNFVPFAAIAVRFALFIALMYFVCLPRIDQLYKETIGRSFESHYLKLFISGFFTKLSFHVILFMVLGIFLIMLDNIALFVPADNTLRRLNGSFSVVGWFMVFTAYFCLLIIWANIYEKTNNLQTRVDVAPKLKVILGVYYVVNTAIWVGGFTALCVYQLTPGSDRNYVNGVRGSMNLIAFVITFLLSFGFLIYGIRMYKILSSIDRHIAIYKIRFTQFMFMTIPALWLTCVWLCLYVAQGLSGGEIFGSWMNLFISTIIDLNFLLLYICMIFVLFDKKAFVNMKIHACCWYIHYKRMERYDKKLEERWLEQDMDLESTKD
ncbi:TOM1 [Acrasis kona]|uniref:TOM1 n=1 Tax=Acrasis kona TaxID=1008807 RepID=A0AAW2YV43_9EUKA